VSENPGRESLEAQLCGLRERADEDYLQPGIDREGGRHQLDLAEMGLRVSITRSRYPNRPDGVDQYAVTVSRTGLDHSPEEHEVRTVLAFTFGAAAAEAVERSAGGARVRMFRVPAAGSLQSA
jgi:hypothetical protein